MFKAEIVADSQNSFGQRLTSFIVIFPRMILAEFNTHRMLSRNSASSRAIPFEKMLKMVWNTPFIPMKWMKDHKGMQGTEFFLKKWFVWVLVKLWLLARTFAIIFAWSFSKLGVTKQICNRLLEPFMWHTVLVTGTEWENFFALRANPAAEIHMERLAGLMLDSYNKSFPRKLKAGQWHIPLGDTISTLRDDFTDHIDWQSDRQRQIDSLIIQIATARCARVSYNNFEGKDDYNADIKLHNTLSSSGHWSPFEHCARVMSEEEYRECVSVEVSSVVDGIVEYTRDYGWSGNFQGFIQYRKMFKGENKSDSRVFKTK